MPTTRDLAVAQQMPSTTPTASGSRPKCCVNRRIVSLNSTVLLATGMPRPSAVVAVQPGGDHLLVHCPTGPLFGLDDLLPGGVTPPGHDVVVDAVVCHSLSFSVGDADEGDGTLGADLDLDLLGGQQRVDQLLDRPDLGLALGDGLLRITNGIARHVSSPFVGRIQLASVSSSRREDTNS